MWNMCIGEIRTATVGSEYAYGATGVPPKIPPNVKLHFEIKLMNIERNRFLRELNNDVVIGPEYS